MIDDLTAALVAEFDGELIFAPWLPPTISPPAVVVAPGDPFLVPGTHGGVVETWRILVAVSITRTADGHRPDPHTVSPRPQSRPIGWSGMAGHCRPQSDQHEFDNGGLRHGDRIPLPT